MKKSYYLFLLILITSCKKDKVINQEHLLENFDKIEINGSFDIVLVNDTVNKLKIITSDKIIDDIIFNISNNRLILSEQIKSKWLKPTMETPIIKIHFNNISEIKMNATCFLSSENTIKQDYFGLILGAKTNSAELTLDCKHFYYWNNYPSGGKLTLKGKSTEINLWNDAIMSVDASELLCDRVLIENNSRGDCIVNASDSLTYSILNSGNIINIKKPNTIKMINHSGEGQLILP